MDLQDTITLFLDESGQHTMGILHQGPYHEKQQEYLQLYKKVLAGNDSPELSRLLQLKVELGEEERKAAQITGMVVMLRLYQTLNGEDKQALQEYCNTESG